MIVYIRIDLMAGLSGGERRRLAAEMKEWFRATSRDLPVGQSRHMPILCGREWAITTYKSHLARHAGSVALRRYPKPPFLPRLRKALKDKVDKLAEYKSDHHILLLERQDYDTPDQWKLAAALKSLKRTHKHKLSRLDEVEVWMADLTCLWMGDGGNAWFHSAWPDNGLDFVQENVNGFAREA